MNTTNATIPSVQKAVSPGGNGVSDGLHDGTIRRRTEAREDAWLDPRASRSTATRGRERPETPDAIRTEFQRDRDRIIHCKAFRRLKHKTQVFISPQRDHYRTRLTHTLEVTQISRTVARALSLNEDLVEAIGMGHDLGHAPFGHVGEEALDEAYRRFDPQARFRHYEHSLRIVDALENSGEGLNLTWEVRDGILHHSKGKSDLLAGQSLDTWLQKGKPSTLEGQIIRICDRVAYVNHDVDDAIRAGLITIQDIPQECIAILGQRHSQRITTMVNAIIEASSERDGNQSTLDGGSVLRVRDRIAMRDDIMQATDALKNWMFNNVYLRNSGDEEPRVRNVICMLFAYYMEHPEAMQGEAAGLCADGRSHQATIDALSKAELARCVCDYIAGMTDRFASETYMQLFMPSSWRGV
jgi:dGTPase